MIRALLRIGLILAILLAISGSFFTYWVNLSLKTPHTHSAEQLFVIEPGMGRKAIVRKLVQEGIVKQSLPLLVYMTVQPAKANLQAGEYLFDSPITPIQVLEKINRGQVATLQLTIPEGYDRFDIVETLIAGQIGDREELEKAVKDTSLIADLDPEAKDLEGYLFPDTYTYTHRTDAQQFVALMVKRYKQILTPERRKRAEELGMTLRQVLILASLIEREAKHDEERPLVSSVFHNRLKKGMKLDCDPTFIYAAKLEGVWDKNVNNPSHRRRNSPYNTYAYPGLPPGPIASPGIKSIDAALNPASADYIYFVVNSADGHHKFSSTENEHLKAVAQYRRLQKQMINN